MTSRARKRRLRTVWTARALSDLEAIGDYITRDDPRAAERWIAKLVALAGKIAAMPYAGRRIPELGREDLREVLLRTYRIMYRVREDRCEILTVFEGHRRFPADFEPPEEG